MKFGKQLEERMQPEWREHYIAYRKLQKSLVQLGKSSDPDPDATWFLLVEDGARKAGKFGDHGLNGLEKQLEALTRSLEDNLPRISSRSDALDALAREQPASDSDDEQPFSKLLYLEAVGRLAGATHQLRDFLELNHAALYKILKKHDKQRGDNDGLGKVFPRLVEATRLDDLSRLDKVEQALQEMSLKLQPKGLVSAGARVVRLVEGLDSTNSNKDLLLGFFLGSCTSLCVATVALLALPGNTPHTFHVTYFLMPMPVFRVVFSVLLLFLCVGAVARCCNSYAINYMFIMKCDMRSKATPGFFFTRAVGLGTLWVLLFGTYVVDYKWGIFPYSEGTARYRHGAAVHFVVYPVLLLAGATALVAWPSRTFRNRYKVEVLCSMKRAAFAPYYQVDFFDNMVGDILTSIAKPLQDIPTAFCYLRSPHPIPRELVDYFHVHGTTCAWWETHFLASFLIAGLPYVFRAMQCLRRFRDTQERKHLYNFGKYASCLLVVVVSYSNPKVTSANSPPFVMVAVVSTIATIYAFLWDVLMDWGIDRQLLFNVMFKRLDSEGSASDGSSPVCSRTQRLLPRRVYWICSLLDLLARFTWVLTLMPISIVTNNIVAKVMLVSCISSIEIFRRSMWAVLRIEWEQVSNASGFRTLLWVPSKLNVMKENCGSDTSDKTMQRLHSCTDGVADASEDVMHNRVPLLADHGHGGRACWCDINTCAD